MKKRFLSLLCVLALCLGLLPATALAAAEGAPNNLYVGNQNVKSGEATTFWTTDSSTGKLTQYTENEDAWNVKYDPNSATLTLKNATIEGGYDDVNTSGAGIYAASSSGPVSLNIVLEEENKVSGMYGIDVSSSGGDASLNISGSGSLTVSGLSGNGIGIFMSSQNSANLTIEEASVTALGSQVGGSGVRLITSQTGSPSLTIEVKGGSLQASGETNGIHFLSNVNDATAVANLKVSGNAMVKASSITTTKDGTGSAPELKPAASGSDGTRGIIWDGKNGTVYGDVTLDENLTIGEGESLTIGKDASLTVPSGTTLTNNGTVTTTDGGSLTNQGTINNSGTLPDSIEGSQPPKITTKSLPNGEVGTAYSQTLAAAGNDTITWSVSGTLPAGLTLNSDGTITGTPTTANTYNFTVTATNDSGSDSKEYTLTIDPKPTVAVTGVTLEPDKLDLFTGESKTLTAKVEPNDATTKAVTWESSDDTIATVEDGTVTAVGAGNATITVTTQDGGKTDTCTVTVTDKTYKISADATALDFGNAYTGYAQPAAKTVTITNDGNQDVTVTLPTSTNYIITAGEGFTDSTATLAPNGTAVFTVQPKAGLAVGTYSENITVTGTNNATLSITASFTVKQYSSGGGTPTKTPSQQATDKIEAAKAGDTVTVNLTTGSTKLNKEVFEKLSGKNVTLEIKLPGGIMWTVNGQDIPADADLTDLDLGVSLNTSTIPVSVINTVTGAMDTIQISLKHDGEFGFTMILSASLGKTNAGYWANLYYYNTRTRALEFQSASKIATDGTASFPFSHASDYAIVIDTDSHEPVELPFTDVPEGAWYEDAAAYVYKHGLMAGTSATTFAPEVTTSRAMIATILWRMAGSPVVNYAMNYTDVAQGQWYSEAVRWATSEGVVTGYGNGLFGTNDPITREQLATMLWRYAQAEGYDVSIGEDTNILSYTDVAALSEYAIPAMQWAVGAGIINGTGDGSTLTPQGQATRAQAAVMLMRFCEEYI